MKGLLDLVVSLVQHISLVPFCFLYSLDPDQTDFVFVSHVLGAAMLFHLASAAVSCRVFTQDG